MDAAGRIELIRRICSFEGRWPGTDAERRTANDLAARLKRMGRRVEVESTFVHPEYALVLLAHVVLAVAASVVGTAIPPAGFGLLLLVAVSLYLDLNTRFYILRRLFFRRASQNVVARGRRPDAPARLYLTAHYDAAKTGLVFNERSMERGARLQRLLPFPLGPFRVLFWGAIVPLLVILGARMAGIDNDRLDIVQLVPTIMLIAAVPLLIDISLSDVVPGANDNASGVATVLSLAERLDRDPPRNLDVWIVLPGAEECLCEGMRSFLHSHRKELRGRDQGTTYFVNVDTVGYGNVHYTTAEGLVVSYPYDARLVALCEAIADADKQDGNSFQARPLAHAFATDALPPRLAGHPSIAITCLRDGPLLPPHYHQPSDTPEHIDPQALDRAHDFTLELVRQIDRDVSRRTSASD